MNIHQQNHWNDITLYWYQSNHSNHWYQWTIGLTNRIRLCILDMCENGPTTSVVCTFFVYSYFNRLFPSFKIFHFQNEAKSKNFLVIMSPICMRIKKNFHINGFTLNLALNRATRKSLIDEVEKPNDTV